MSEFTPLREAVDTLAGRRPSPDFGDLQRRATRRGRRRVVIVGAATAAVIAGSAIAFGSLHGDQRTAPIEQPKPAVGAAPKPGTCWQIPPDKVADPDYWFDDSPVVACTESHTTETAEVVELEQPSVSTAKKNVDLCSTYARVYAGATREHWVPWGYVAVLPSKAQIAGGASWMRCEVYFPGDWAFTSVREVSFSAENAATEHDDELWACLNEDPRLPEQPFVSCREPHRYEETGKGAFILNVDTYPSPQQLRQAADHCAQTLTQEQRSRATDTTAVWPSKGEFAPGDFDGMCFMYRGDGGLLEPRP